MQIPNPLAVNSGNLNKPLPKPISLVNTTPVVKVTPRLPQVLSPQIVAPNTPRPRVTISTLQSFMETLKKYPTLLSLPVFSPIVQLFKTIEQTKGGCGSCAKRKQLSNNRALFETCLNGLSEEDKKKIKSVLNTQEVCYYTVRADNQLKLVCF